MTIDMAKVHTSGSSALNLIEVYGEMVVKMALDMCETSMTM